MGRVGIPKGFDPQRIRHWYLVANRKEAVLYEGQPGNDFRFLRRLENPQGKLTERELVADRPGRVFASARSGTRHAYEPRSLYHEEVARQFARRIGKVLEKDALQEEFSDLVILAEPHFLGLLHQQLSKKVRSLVRRELPREWHQGSDEELQDYLQQNLS